MKYLVANAKKYYGQYVTTKSFSSNRVVTHGKDPVDVMKRARKKGIEDTVLIFVPDSKIPHIY